MRVWYGYTKLTKKAVRKRELAIFFENSNSGNHQRKERFITRRITIVYERYQTKEEREDGRHCNREFIKYGYFIDAKPFYGDIDKVLQVNFEADKNHVSIEERKEIRDKLRKAYFECYNIEEKKQQQLKLEL